MNISDYATNPIDKRLISALSERMKTEPIDKISMSSVLKDSGVSRSTFYRHYRDKYDLLNKNYQLLLDSTLFKLGDGITYKSMFYQLYSTISMIPSIFKSAFSSEDRNSLRNYIYDQSYIAFEEILKEYGMDMSDRYNQMLLCGDIAAGLEVLNQWVKDDMKESIDTMYRLSIQLMPEEMRTLIILHCM